MEILLHKKCNHLNFTSQYHSCIVSNKFFILQKNNLYHFIMNISSNTIGRVTKNIETRLKYIRSSKTMSDNSQDKS